MGQSASALDVDAPPAPSHAGAEPGGSRELLTLAGPLIVGNAFITLQLNIDRMMLSWADQDMLAAAFPAAMLFWLPFSLLQGTAGYVTTFVAQYTGAGRPSRVGPAVWQGLYFSLVTGVLFVGLWPAAPWYVGLGGHPAHIQALEVEYLRVLVFAALPGLVTATVSGFFSGRGSTVAVLGINAAGLVVNAILAYLLIFGKFGLPRLGMAGAGWATVAASAASAGLALALLFGPRLRREFGTLSGWRPEPALLARLLRFGGPAGVQMAVDVFAFTLFTLHVGQIGTAEAAATTIAVSLNLFAFLPAVGMGQAVSVLVGQRLGEDRPDLAARSARLGVRWTAGFMLLIGAVFVGLPELLVSPFRPDPAAAGSDKWDATAAVVPPLLTFVAVYSIADAASIVYAGALRGAGDTRFITWAAFGLAVPVMVVPTYLVVEAAPGSAFDRLAGAFGGRVYLAWAFATLYIVLLAAVFWLRFRAGRWRRMRVIEPAPV